MGIMQNCGEIWKEFYLGLEVTVAMRATRERYILNFDYVVTNTISHIKHYLALVLISYTIFIGPHHQEQLRNLIISPCLILGLVHSISTLPFKKKENRV
jgi:hypothetical protein